MTHRILMLDDSTLSLEFQTMLLHRAGFEVASITSAGQLDDIEPNWPDAVLVDGNMPDATAPDAFAAIRKRHPRARLILVSGLDGPDLRNLARECRADGFVCKGENIDELPNILREVLAYATAPVEDKTKALHDKFLSLLPARSAKARDCIGDLANRRKEALRLAHTTKGEARLLGLNAIADTIKSLEDLLKGDSEDSDAMTALLDRIAVLRDDAGGGA